MFKKFLPVCFVSIVAGCGSTVIVEDPTPCNDSSVGGSGGGTESVAETVGSSGGSGSVSGSGGDDTSSQGGGSATGVGGSGGLGGSGGQDSSGGQGGA